MAPHPLLDLVRRRISVEEFDATHRLSEDQIRDLVADAAHAPSSFNIQHWRFVAVHRDEDKPRLQEIAFGQQQVADAAVTFIVLGDVRGTEKLPQILQRAVDADMMPQGKADAWVRMAGGIYSDETVARDEAIRSATLASMVLMLAAEARGWASGALSGFDAERVMQEFSIDPRYVPVMLLAVGRPVSHDDARKPRLEVDEILAFDRCRIF
ncbi:MAG: nitroreductase family protein [bacterium]|nr:nitroreductase family protein [bacterium]